MWMLCGNGSDGDWKPEFYNTKKQAKKVFDTLVSEREYLYDVKVNVTPREDGGYTAKYDNGSGHNEFWYMSKVVKD